MAVPDISDIPRELLQALLDNPHESQILVDKDGAPNWQPARRNPWPRRRPPSPPSPLSGPRAR